MKKIINNIKNNIKQNREKLPLTQDHRKLIRQMEKDFLNVEKNSLRIKLHDIDKIIFYKYLPFVSPKFIKKQHKYRHHSRRNVSKYCFSKSLVREIIFDWESSQYKPYTDGLSAREYMEDFQPQMRYVLEPVLKELGL